MPPKEVKLPKNIIGVCSDYIGHYKWLEFNWCW
jgi:hypothetical protein